MIAGCILTIGERHDLLMDPCCFTSTIYFLIACIPSVIAEVTHNGTVKQIWVLWYDPYVRKETIFAASVRKVATML